jgi:phage terminase large subunit
MFQRTTAQSKIASLRKRVRIVQGGTSSSKTFSIIPLLIQYAIQVPYSEISIVSESIPHLKRGAIKDFVKIMLWTDNYKDENFNKSSLKYTFSNGSFIEFFSADQPDKLRGARRDVLFINECNNVSFEAYQQLAIRTKKFVYLDYNPSNEFWVHEHLINDNDSDFIILTYKDNEALDQAIVKEIEKAKERALTSAYWDNWWKVYGLGQLGSLQNTIFEFELIDELPKEAQLLSYGLDFGFSNDPASLVGVYRYNNSLVVDELIYQRQLTNSDLVAKFKELKINDYDRIVADSAEPKSIEDIYRMGYKAIEPAKKGQDSVRASIDLIRQNKLLVTKNSLNLIRELRGYVWQTDKDGTQLTKPIDSNNHAIDALRYSCLNCLTANTGEYYII